MDQVPPGLDPLYYAQMLLHRRRQPAACAAVCTQMLAANPYDKVGVEVKSCS